MNTSSAQDSFSITLNDTVTIDTSTWNFTAGSVGGSSMDTITISGGGAGSSYTIGSGAGVIAQDIGSISGTAFTWKMPEEFVDAFPDYDNPRDKK